MSQASLTLPLVTLLFVAGLGLTGLFLWLTGWRGRKLDDHPVCRHCRFDLSGTPRGEDDEPPKCPECGWRREPRIGNRQRSGVRLAAGVLLMGLALVGCGVVGWSRADASGLAAYKPVWLLRIEARAGESDAAAVALRELTDRLLAGELSADQGEQLIVEALTHGPAGNPAVYHASIGSSWDRLAAELMRAGHGKDEQRVELAKSWLDLSVRVRPKVEQGAVLPMELSGGTYGPPTDVGLWRTPQQASVTIHGQTHPIGYSRSGPMEGGRGFGPSSAAQLMALEPGRGLPPDLPVGHYTLRVERPVEITNGPSGNVFAAWIHVEDCSFEVVEMGQDIVTLITDRKMGVRFEKLVTVTEHHIHLGRNSFAAIDISYVPTAVSYRVFARQGPRLWRVGDVVLEPHDRPLEQRLDVEAFGELADGTTVDLIFEPAPDLASSGVGINEILNHRFEIRGVPVCNAQQCP